MAKQPGLQIKTLVCNNCARTLQLPWCDLVLPAGGVVVADGMYPEKLGTRQDLRDALDIDLAAGRYTLHYFSNQPVYPMSKLAAVLEAAKTDIHAARAAAPASSPEPVAKPRKADAPPAQLQAPQDFRLPAPELPNRQPVRLDRFGNPVNESENPLLKPEAPPVPAPAATRYIGSPDSVNRPELVIGRETATGGQVVFGSACAAPPAQPLHGAPAPRVASFEASPMGAPAPAPAPAPVAADAAQVPDIPASAEDRQETSGRKGQSRRSGKRTRV